MSTTTHTRMHVCAKYACGASDLAPRPQTASMGWPGSLCTHPPPTNCARSLLVPTLKARFPRYFLLSTSKLGAVACRGALFRWNFANVHGRLILHGRHSSTDVDVQRALDSLASVVWCDRDSIVAHKLAYRTHQGVDIHCQLLKRSDGGAQYPSAAVLAELGTPTKAGTGRQGGHQWMGARRSHHARPQ